MGGGGDKVTAPVARFRLIFAIAYSVRHDTKPHIPTHQSNYRVVKVNPATVKPIFAPLFNSPPSIVKSTLWRWISCVHLQYYCLNFRIWSINFSSRWGIVGIISSAIYFINLFVLFRSRSFNSILVSHFQQRQPQWSDFHRQFTIGPWNVEWTVHYFWRW